MTANRRIFLNIVAIYGRSLYALAIGLFCGLWALMVDSGGVSDMYSHRSPVMIHRAGSMTASCGKPDVSMAARWDVAGRVHTATTELIHGIMFSVKFFKGSPETIANDDKRRGESEKFCLLWER